MNDEEKNILLASTFCNNKKNNNNSMKNYELLVEQNKILNELLDKINNLDLNIQYIFKSFKEKENNKELEKNGWFY